MNDSDDADNVNDVNVNDVDVNDSDDLYGVDKIYDADIFSNGVK